MAYSRFRRRRPRTIMATLRASVSLWSLLTGSRSAERVCFRARTRPQLGTLLQPLPGPCGAALPCRRLGSEAGKWPVRCPRRVFMGDPEPACGWREPRGPHPLTPVSRFSSSAPLGPAGAVLYLVPAGSVVVCLCNSFSHLTNGAWDRLLAMFGTVLCLGDTAN